MKNRLIMAIDVKTVESYVIDEKGIAEDDPRFEVCVEHMVKYLEEHGDIFGEVDSAFCDFVDNWKE